MRTHPITEFCYRLSRGTISCASVLLPPVTRRDWMQEWHAELWYVRDQCHQSSGSWVGPAGVLRFAAGACVDAMLLCRGQGSWSARLSAPRGSAQECFARLFAALAVAVGIALLLPNVREHLRPVHVAHAQELMLIENSLAAERGDPRLPLKQYLNWAHLKQRVFAQFAFYEVEEQRLQPLSSTGPKNVRVARVHGDVFALLGLQAEQVLGRSPGEQQDGVVISQSLYQASIRDHGRNGELAIVLNGHRVPVRAVAPFALASLPGHPEVWTALQTPQSGSAGTGYLLGRVSPNFHEASWGTGWHMAAPTTNGDTEDFTCVSLDQSLRQPWDLFVFAVLLAMLALPATTSLPLGEYRFRQDDLPCRVQARRWGFLAAKLALMLVVVYVGCIDLAFADPQLSRGTAEWVELVSCFGGCLWGLRWTLRDQRQRCPVCLGKLSQPARVGHPSRYFLAWSGTELICAGGHGLLHVPEIATSWFGTQRWLALDSSWQVLFPGRRTPSTVYF